MEDPNSFPSTSSQESFADDDERETITDAINQGNIDLAINKLENNVLDTADSSFGGLESNDFIQNPEDLTKVKSISDRCSSIS